MRRVIVTGMGTGVGKTVVSAILTGALQADYWKPIECGPEEESDSKIIKDLLPYTKVHMPAYSLKAPKSPHHAAKLENKTIEASKITPPKTSSPLVIETAGGPLAPLNDTLLTVDLLTTWKCPWIVVANCYLGSIHHTLSTVEVLRKRDCNLLGIVLNGAFENESASAILCHSKLSCLAKISEERAIHQNTILTYVEQWKTKHFLSLI